MAEWLIWLIIVCVAAIAEVATMELVGVWFVAGGLVSLILSLIGGVPLWVQIVVFAVISLILLLGCRKICLKYFLRNTNEKTNVDSFVNKECKLLESISPTQPGSVKINGVTWTVIADSDDKEISADTMVVVKEVKGNKLVVKVKGE